MIPARAALLSLFATLLPAPLLAEDGRQVPGVIALTGARGGPVDMALSEGLVRRLATAMGAVPTDEAGMTALEDAHLSTTERAAARASAVGTGSPRAGPRWRGAPGRARI